MKSYIDKNLKSSTHYYYYIRAVCRIKYIKSPFAQMVGVRTKPADNMFSKILYPDADKIGYVGEKTKKNKEHFANNSLFVGISEEKGECFGVSGFSLNSVPENAIITEASISFYPMNRVSVQVERYGEWRVGQMDERTLEHIDSYDEIKNVRMLSYIDQPTGSAQLAQGIWKKYKFASQEIDILQKSLKRREAYFRMEGPSSLPLDRSSQLMQWDIGYGSFSGGLTYRPKLDISYTISEAKIDLQSSSEFTISEKNLEEGSLKAGFDGSGNIIYACVEFDLSNLPDMENTVISNAYIDIEAQAINTKENLRFHMEMIVPCEGEKTYQKIRNRKIIERIGYDVSISDIKESAKQRFVFDTYTINEMIRMAQSSKKILFVLSASSQKIISKAESVRWLDLKRVNRPSLVVGYIRKRRSAPKSVKNLSHFIENGVIKLTWEAPDDDGFQGVIVVKNPFKVPCSPYDGQKLYGGSDTYTYDNFGDKEAHKFYAVYSYDDVPNFSEPAFIEINM